MNSISEKQAKTYGACTVASAFLAVFCLFGYRSSFSIMQSLIIADTGWSTIQTSLGYCVMMTVYAVTAFFSGSLVDRKGTRPTYFIGAVCCFLGFFLTSVLVRPGTPGAYATYLFTYGLFAGVGTGMLWVSSTISCRQWFVGARYGSMWGIAFAGAPLAQLLLTLVLKPVLRNMGWQAGMKLMAFVCAAFLVAAALIAKRTPAYYNVTPFGLSTGKAPANANAKPVSLKEAFRTYAIWGDILCFLTAMVGEFLIWSQAVGFFQTDMHLSADKAASVYMMIGLFGVFMMPVTGKISDFLVKKTGNEIKGRRIMLIAGPLCGALGVALCLTKNILFVCLAMLLLATYWGIEPGGCAGYAGAVFGGAGLGKTWGFATLIVMGIGPSFGTFMGAWFKDHYGSYVPAFIFCLCAFLLSGVLAVTLPKKSIRGDN